MKISKAEFVKSIADYKTAKILPKPQIALVGRSNVGKSTLINILCSQNKLAKVSSSPGKTRLINLFNINDDFYLVDLPGYGYAKVNPQEKDRWSEMMENYFALAKDLKHIFLLMDIRREPSQDDLQMSLWIQHSAIPCTIIATKADKLPKSRRKPAASLLSDKLAMTFATPTIIFSSLEKSGISEIRQRIGDIMDDKPLYKRD
ncbi:MAG: YihA family ribosome biogenesis GTP-binding protein [Clostridia bacterium]|nr:YihA family ribosome biogenesis GTP-binding protein [Clostridia bacterium]